MREMDAAVSREKPWMRLTEQTKIVIVLMIRVILLMGKMMMSSLTMVQRSRNKGIRNVRQGSGVLCFDWPFERSACLNYEKTAYQIIVSDRRDCSEGILESTERCRSRRSSWHCRQD